MPWKSTVCAPPSKGGLGKLDSMQELKGRATARVAEQTKAVQIEGFGQSADDRRRQGVENPCPQRRVQAFGQGHMEVKITKPIRIPPAIQLPDLPRGQGRIEPLGSLLLRHGGTKPVQLRGAGSGDGAKRVLIAVGTKRQKTRDLAQF